MRVALYCRVSTDEQALHGLSIEAQKAALEKWAANHTIIDFYIDGGVSARKSILKRPELQRLLKDVERDKIDLIAFTKLDRWTRNIREYYKAQDILDAHNVAWRAIQEDYETETASGRLKVNIMLSIAQDEADRTSERVKAVFEEKRRKGEVLNGHMPYGIKYDGEMKPGKDADKVKILFDRYIAIRSVTALAGETAQLVGRTFSPRGLKQMLQNPKYVQAGIVTQETFDHVQEIMKIRTVRNSRSDRIYLFSGLLICPVCGRRLSVRTRIWNGKEYIYYKCDHYAKEKSCTYKGGVREDKLEDYLLDTIVRVVKGHTLRIRKKQKKVDVPALKKKLDRLTDLYVEGMISREDFDSRSSPLRDEIRVAESTHEPNVDEIIDALDAYSTLSKKAQKAFWSFLIKSIVPTENGFNITLF